LLEAIPVAANLEPKVVKKVHPGAERSILRSGGSSSEALPGAMESILGQKMLSLKKLKLILELCKLILEPWRITWIIVVHPGDAEDQLGDKAALQSRGGLPWSCGGSSWSYGGSHRSFGGMPWSFGGFSF